MRTTKNPNRDEFFENSITEFQIKKKYKRKSFEPYKLYIPENLDIDKLLREHPPQFKGIPKNYSIYRSKFLYIVHLISSIPNSINDFDFEENLGFTPINKVYLQKRIHDYRFYVQYLIDQGIITEGTSYTPLIKSKGLKFTPEYCTIVKVETITCNSLIKSIVIHKNRDVEKEKKLSFMLNWFNKQLKIDYDAALKYITDDQHEAIKKATKKRARKKFTAKQELLLPSIDEVVRLGNSSKIFTVTQIEKADYLHKLKFDLTTGRFHTPLTRLKKELRKFITYNKEKLINIDIINSQPLMSLIILDIEIFRRLNIKNLICKYNPSFRDKEEVIGDRTNHNNIKESPSYTMLVNLIVAGEIKADVIEYKKAVISGKFYERFGQILLAKNLIPVEILAIDNYDARFQAIRKFAKIATFQSFFDTQRAHYYNPIVKAFKSCFPNVYAIFQGVKTGKREVIRKGMIFEESTYNTLACILQRFESYLVLEKICLEIHETNANIPIFTIHDSVSTTINNLAFVYQIFAKNVEELLGINPCLEKQDW